jgi:hypothetical protein
MGVDNFKALPLEVENRDRIITMVKNWLDDMHTDYKPNSNFNQYLKVKESLAEDNYNLIEEHYFLKELEFDDE